MGILIMMNNYFHDAATAVLLVSAVMLFVYARRVEQFSESPQVAAFFIRAYRDLSALMRLSLAWIVIGGVVRTAAYMKYEWLPAAGRGQVPALIVKHILIFSALAIGIYYWIKIRSLAENMMKRMEGDGNEKA